MKAAIPILLCGPAAANAVFSSTTSHSPSAFPSRIITKTTYDTTVRSIAPHRNVLNNGRPISLPDPSILANRTQSSESSALYSSLELQNAQVSRAALQDPYILVNPLQSPNVDDAADLTIPPHRTIPHKPTIPQISPTGVPISTDAVSARFLRWETTTRKRDYHTDFANIPNRGPFAAAQSPSSDPKNQGNFNGTDPQPYWEIMITMNGWDVRFPVLTQDAKVFCKSIAKMTTTKGSGSSATASMMGSGSGGSSTTKSDGESSASVTDAPKSSSRGGKTSLDAPASSSESEVTITSSATETSGTESPIPITHKPSKSKESKTTSESLPSFILLSTDAGSDPTSTDGGSIPILPSGTADNPCPSTGCATPTSEEPVPIEPTSKKGKPSAALSASATPTSEEAVPISEETGKILISAAPSKSDDASQPTSLLGTADQPCPSTGCAPSTPTDAVPISQVEPTSKKHNSLTVPSASAIPTSEEATSTPEDTSKKGKPTAAPSDSDALPIQSAPTDGVVGESGEVADGSPRETAKQRARATTNGEDDVHPWPPAPFAWKKGRAKREDEAPSGKKDSSASEDQDSQDETFTEDDNNFPPIPSPSASRKKITAQKTTSTSDDFDDSTVTDASEPEETDEPSSTRPSFGVITTQSHSSTKVDPTSDPETSDSNSELESSTSAEESSTTSHGGTHTLSPGTRPSKTASQKPSTTDSSFSSSKVISPGTITLPGDDPPTDSPDDPTTTSKPSKSYKPTETDGDEETTTTDEGEESKTETGKPSKTPHQTSGGVEVRDKMILPFVGTIGVLFWISGLYQFMRQARGWHASINEVNRALTCYGNKKSA